jgi:hypothetical protein
LGTAVWVTVITAVDVNVCPGAWLTSILVSAVGVTVVVLATFLNDVWRLAVMVVVTVPGVAVTDVVIEVLVVNVVGIIAPQLELS